MKRSSEQRKSAKRARNGVPCIEIPLSDDWSTVILTNGNRFYYNSRRKRSYWQIPSEDLDTEDGKTADKKVYELKDAILLSIGIVRGFDWKNCDVSEKLREEVDTIVGKAKSEDTEGKDEDTENKDKDEKKITINTNEDTNTNEDANTNGDKNAYEDTNSNEDTNAVENADEKLAIGYSSDSSDSSGSSESDSNDFGLDLQDLDELSKEDDAEDVTEAAQIYDKYSDNAQALAFLKMLTRKKIDPYSAFTLEQDNLIDEPEYLAIDDEDTTEELFDYWCEKNKKETPKPISAEDEFINWLKTIPKLPKYYFELRRRYAHDSTFTSLELDNRQKQRIFKNYTK